MPTVGEICRHVRSKNAGPFWITVDFFFPDAQTYARYRDSDCLGPSLFRDLYGAEAQWVRRTCIDDLAVIKVSFPRPVPQGGPEERDMHGGQLFARLLDAELDGDPA